MDSELKKHLDLIENNQKAIHDQILHAHKDLAGTLATVVAILRGIEDELKRQRK